MRSLKPISSPGLSIDAERCLISSGTFLELSIVIEGQLGTGGVHQCDMFLRRAGIPRDLISVTVLPVH
jgi:hypothetical protein